MSASSKKKVVCFLGSGVGGAERMTVKIGKYLSESNFETVFVIIDKDEGDIKNFIPDNIRTTYVHISNIYDFTTIKMINILRKEKPYAVFSSLMYLNIRVILAAKLYGNVKIIIRNDNTIFSIDSFSRKLVKLYRYADRIIAQQEEMGQEIMGCLNIKKERIAVLHNPVDTETIDKDVSSISPYNANDEIRFLWVARFGYTKGQDVLVRAFKEVHDILENAHLYLIGNYNTEPNFYKDILKYIEENNLGDYVHMEGFKKNPYVWVQHCDCFVQPSRLEGLPNALIEAMYLKKPVVAAACIPIIRRIVKDGYNGYVVESEDVHAMAESMVRALSLKDFEMTYKSASKEDFVNVFK